MRRVVVRRALGQHDAAGGQEVPDAVEPRLAVDVVEVVALAVAGRVRDGLEVAVEELLPGVLVHDRGGRQDAVEVKEDGGGAGSAAGGPVVSGTQSWSMSFQAAGSQDAGR